MYTYEMMTIDADKMRAVANNEQSSAWLTELTLKQATGEVYMEGQDVSVVDVEILDGPIDQIGRDVDAVEEAFAPKYDSSEYVENMALRVLSANELAGIIMPRRQIAVRPRVLDIGCGTGRIAALLAYKHCDVTAIDQTIGYCDITASKLRQMTGVVANVKRLPMEELERVGRLEFDAVTCMFAPLNHSSDWRGSLAKIAGALRAGGILNMGNYGSYDAKIIQALTSGELDYEPSILVRRTPKIQTPSGIYLGETAKDLLPATFIEPAEMTEELQRLGLDAGDSMKPLIPMTAFYPKDATPESLEKFGMLVRGKIDRAVGEKLLRLTTQPNRAHWTSAVAETKELNFKIEDGAYFGFSARKVAL